MNTKKEAAKFYVSHGFSIVPFYVAAPEGWKAPQGKDGKPVEWRPKCLIGDWDKEHKLGSRIPSLAEVEKWWERWPDADIAIVTGKVSGITVIDTEKGADLALYGLENSDTVQATSGGGGRHFYFAYTPEVKNSVKFAPLYDIRNDNGLIFAPPSDHKSGGKYSWYLPMGAAEFLPMPLSIVQAFKEKKGEYTQKDWKNVIGGEVGEGGRNDTATSFVGKLALRFPEKEWETHAWPILLNWNENVPKPALSEDELRAVFMSITAAERRRRASGNSQGTPTVSREKSAIVVHIPLQDEGFAVFSFTDPVILRRDLEALVRAHVQLPGQQIRQFEQRLCVYSNQSREGYARQLRDAYGKDQKWSLILSEACAAFSAEYRRTAADDIVSAYDIVPEKPEFLLFPFIEQGSANMLFALGGVGKTYLALRFAMSVVSGCSFLGVEPLRTGKVLFVDYENSQGTFRNRVGRLAPFCKGFTDDMMKRLYYKESGGLPLPEMKESLRKFVADNGIDFIIIDSAAPACGGAPEDAVIATAYMSALREIGVTSLTIGHEAKQDNGKWMFGSVFFTNLGRNVWHIKAEDNQQGAKRILRLEHRKFNNGPLSPDIGYSMFDGALGMEFAPCEPPETDHTTTDKILAAIGYAELSPAEISKVTLIPSKTVSNNLSRMKDRGVIVQGSRPGKWKIKS